VAAIIHEADLANTRAQLAAGMEAGSAGKIGVTKAAVMLN